MKFPTPFEAARLDDLNAAIRHSQQSERILAAARAFATMDEQWLRSASYNEVEGWLKQIPGIGDARRPRHLKQHGEDVSMQPLNAEQLAQLNATQADNLAGTLGMEIIEAGPERIVARMPVLPRVKQPYGVLHGGATVALCETAASLGTYLGIDQTRFNAFGLEINCNHLRPMFSGHITAIATPVHRGRTTWVWDIRVQNDEGKLTAISRCTVAVVPKTGTE